MTLELELLIAAWDNYKKNDIAPRPESNMSETEAALDELMIKLLDEKEE